MRSLLRYGVILLVLFLSSCTLLGVVTEKTVEHRLANPAFQQENLPLRTLRVAVLTESIGEDAQLSTAFTDASALLEQQVGIRLDIKIFHDLPWRGRSLFAIHRQVEQFRETHQEFDIVVGVALTFNNSEAWCWHNEEKGFDECIGGMVKEARNIALHTILSVLIAHEFGHTFLGIWHSKGGLMESFPVDKYFLESDRKRVLQNKWKDFHQRPNLLKRCFSFC